MRRRWGIVAASTMHRMIACTPLLCREFLAASVPALGVHISRLTRRWWPWVLGWLWVLLGASLALNATGAQAAPPEGGPLTLSQAQWQASSSATPPAGPWSSTKLPDDWTLKHPGHSGQIWYHLRFDAAPSWPRSGASAGTGEVMAIWIQRACTNAEVFVNGVLIYSGGRMQEPLTRNCHRPHLAAFGASLLKPQGNELNVRLVGSSVNTLANQQRAGGLSEIKVGYLRDLQGLHDAETFWHFDIFAYTAPPLVALALMLMTLSLLAKVDTPMRLFAWVLLGSVAGTARVWWVESPWDTVTTESLLASLRIWTGIAGLGFLMQLAQVRPAWLYRGLVLEGLLFSGLMLVGRGPWLHSLSTAIHLMLAVQLLIALLHCVRHMIRHPQPRAKAWHNAT